MLGGWAACLALGEERVRGSLQGTIGLRGAYLEKAVEKAVEKVVEKVDRRSRVRHKE